MSVNYNYIIPLDLGDTSADKSLFYLRRGLGEIELSARGVH